MPSFNQKGIAHLFLLVLLAAGIGLGVYLVNQKTNIFPQAASDPIGTPCIPRPLCLDQKPSCKLPPPKEGWCPSSDSDNDGFNDEVEKSLGTNPKSACPVKKKDDAWPPDLNMDGVVNFLDLSSFTKYLNNPKKHNKRYDINLDGKVTKDDMDIVSKYLGQSCKDINSSPTPTPTPCPSGTMTIYGDPQGGGSGIIKCIPWPSPTPVPSPYCDKLGPDGKLIPCQSASPSGDYLKVTYPNGGESFKVGDTVRIKWETSFANHDVGIVRTDGTVKVLAAIKKIPEGYLDWVVDESFAGQQLKVRVAGYNYSDPNSNEITDNSDNFFNVVPIPSPGCSYVSCGWPPSVPKGCKVIQDKVKVCGPGPLPLCNMVCQSSSPSSSGVPSASGEKVF